MKALRPLYFLLAAAFFLIGKASATTITYEVTGLGSGRYEYEYTVTNDTLADPIEELTIYFDYGLFSNLDAGTNLANWDELVVQPELVLGTPTDGYFDVLALGGGIAPGGTVSGFTVSFLWLGTGGALPGAQRFDVVDPDSFAVLETGVPTLPTGAPVPEPGTLLLVGSGLVGLVRGRKRFRRG